MKRFFGFCLLILAICTVASSASTLVNCNFGHSNTTGDVGTGQYGLLGTSSDTWNNLYPYSSGVSLNDSTGVGSGLTITTDLNSAWYNQSYTFSSPYTILKGYNITTSGTATITISGCTDGAYDLYIYNAFQWSTDSSTYTINGTSQTISNNPFDVTAFVDGQNYVVFENVASVSGQIVITVTGTNGGISALQLLSLEPSISPSGPYLSVPAEVTISSESAEANIYYTTDGTTPSETNGTLYTGAISVTATGTLEVRAIAIEGGVSSSVTSQTYTVLPSAAMTGGKATLINCNFARGGYGDTVGLGQYGVLGTGSDKWNNIYTGNSVSLLDSRGNNSGVGLTEDGFTGSWYNQSYTFSAPYTILKAYNQTTGTATVTLSGFSDGLYDLYVYDAFQFIPNYSTTYSVNGVSKTVGSDPLNVTSFVDGENYTVFEDVAPVDGQIVLTVYSQNYSGSVSGTICALQLASLAPSFSPAGPYITDPTDLTISSLDESVSIYYTTNGSTPSATNGTLYSGAITVDNTGTLELKAVAVKGGYTSSVTSQTYTVLSSPEATGGKAVLVNCNFGPTTTAGNVGIGQYGLLGTSLDTWNDLYPNDDESLLDSSGKNCGLGITAENFTSAYYNSNYTFSSPYTILKGYNITSGTATVTLSGFSDGMYDLYIYNAFQWTTDSSTYIINGTSKTISNNPFDVTSFVEGQNYVVFEDVTPVDGQIVITVTGSNSGVCALQLASLAPTFSPSGPYISVPTDVAISSVDGDVSIYYTTDGTTPSESNGTLYNGAISVTDTGTFQLQAVAVKAGYTSEVTSQTYTVLSSPVTNGKAALVNCNFARSGYGEISTGQYGVLGASSDAWTNVYVGDTNVSLCDSRGENSRLSLSEANFTGSWYNSSYTFSSPYTILYSYNETNKTDGTATVTISGFTTGTYDLYIYNALQWLAGYDTRYKVNGIFKHVINDPFNVTSFVDGQNYVVFEDVVPVDGQIVIHVYAQNYSGSVSGSICALQLQSLAPTFAPTGPYISGPTNVSISSADANASIYYTTDGSTPSATNGTLYTAAVSIADGVTLKAVAVTTNGNASLVTSQTYKVLSSPVTSGEAITNGTFDDGLNGWCAWSNDGSDWMDYSFCSGSSWTSTLDVGSISAGTVGAFAQGIHDTAEGSFGLYQVVPVINGQWYAVDADWKSTTALGSEDSCELIVYNATFDEINNMGTVLYDIDDEFCEKMIIAKKDAVLNDGASVWDWESVTASMSGAFNHTRGTNKFQATKDYVVVITKYGISDDVQLAWDNISLVPITATPTFIPTGPYITGPTDVTISCATSGASIYYTIDGSDPATNGIAATSPATVAVNDGTFLRAVAIGSDTSRETRMRYVLKTIPVAGWDATPLVSNLANYQEMYECGFTHEIRYTFDDDAIVDDVLKHLNDAQDAGVRLIPSYYDYVSKASVQAYAIAYAGYSPIRDHSALEAYFVRDEPATNEYTNLANVVQQIQALDDDHWSYIVLWHPLDDDFYNRFLNAVPVEVLSYDQYPIKTTGIDSDFYENMEIASASAKAKGIPYWGFALSSSHFSMPVPTLTHLRFQMFSHLAYGAQGLQYFTYFQPTFIESPVAPIDGDGNKTAVWYVLQEMNEEIKGLSPVFLGAEVVSVGHTGTLPDGTTAYTASAPISSVTTSGSDGAVVSELINGDNKYLVVVNRDIDSTMTLTIGLDGSKDLSRVFKDGSETAITTGSVTYTVDPADIVVLKWSDALIPGDANGDGAVDVGDLGILAANYGTTSGATWAMGDFTGDGAVDVGDLGVLAANYGTGSSSSCDFDVDYEKVFAANDSDAIAEDEVGGTLCSSLGLSLIAGLVLLGLMIVKLDK